MTVTNRKGRKVSNRKGRKVSRKERKVSPNALVDWTALLLNRAQVLQAYGGKSISWLYEEMAAGRVPRPIRIGRNSVAWVSAQIRRDIEAKIAVGPVQLTAKPRNRKSSAVPAPA
jgi:predicted DNA-binding transcriptional regulator AlpA